jgi:hypothetical protein
MTEEQQSVLLVRQPLQKIEDRSAEKKANVV